MKNKEWIYIGYQPVGGLREIGFIKNSDFLMVLGGGGRTVFDCLSSIKYARDRSDYYSEKWNSNTGIIEGFGEFEDLNINCGGFEYHDIISKQTSDNWYTKVKSEKRYDYKNELKGAEVLYLTNSQTEMEISVQVFHYGITRSYGFSPTNNTFVVAESHGIYFWKRISHDLPKLKEDAIQLIKSKSGRTIEVTDSIATIGLSMEPYQTSTSKATIENLVVEDNVNGSMIRLVGNQTQIEIRKNAIKQFEASNDTLQIDMQLREVVWRRIVIK